MSTTTDAVEIGLSLLERVTKQIFEAMRAGDKERLVELERRLIGGEVAETEAEIALRRQRLEQG